MREKRPDKKLILKHPFITCSHHNKGTEQNNKYNYACIVTLYIVIDFVGRFLYDEVQLGKKHKGHSLLSIVCRYDLLVLFYPHPDNRLVSIQFIFYNTRKLAMGKQT